MVCDEIAEIFTMACDEIFERSEHPSGGSAPRRPVQGGALGGGLPPTPYILPFTLCNSNREKIIRIEANPFAVSVCSRSNREKIAISRNAFRPDSTSTSCAGPSTRSRRAATPLAAYGSRITSLSARFMAGHQSGNTASAPALSDTVRRPPTAPIRRLAFPGDGRHSLISIRHSFRIEIGVTP